jgi:hypothetical protein
MKLSIKLLHLSAMVLTGVLFSMCTTDEGVKPSDDAIISSRGLISGGSSTVYLIGLTEKNELVNLTVAHTATETSVVPITGLRDGETILAIDNNTKTKALFGVSDASTVYKIDPVTGLARPLGDPFKPPLNGKYVALDVSPQDANLRVTTDGGLNLRVSPITGQTIAEDPFIGVVPGGINSIAYLPSLSGGKALLYTLDISTNALYRQLNANGGTMQLIGYTGFTWRLEGGFDIALSGIGYTVQYGHGNVSGGPVIGSSDDVTEDDFRIHSINLKTGKATSLGPVRPMIGLCVK